MDAAIAELKKTSPNVEGMLCDLKSFDSVRKAAKDVKAKINHLDTLILNAGIFSEQN